jgi:hypothetical protein
LQNAWNLHGEASFEFTVLEHLAAPQLLIAEQKWVQRTGCTDRRTGFNIKQEATSPGEGIGRTWSGFRDPDGNPNLSALCRACGLCVCHMHELKSGKRTSHKGWTWAHDADQAFE